jgi:hypothetical protein
MGGKATAQGRPQTGAVLCELGNEPAGSLSHRADLLAGRPLGFRRSVRLAGGLFLTLVSGRVVTGGRHPATDDHSIRGPGRVVTGGRHPATDDHSIRGPERARP